MTRVLHGGAVRSASIAGPVRLVALTAAVGALVGCGSTDERTAEDIRRDMDAEVARLNS